MPNVFVNRSDNINIAYLLFKNKKISCVIGKNGIGVKKKEGDFITPKGVFKVLRVFYRPDKLRRIKSGIPVFEIKKKHKWCTDPKNLNYNSLLTKKVNCIYENLFRDDDIYDLVLVLNYNLKKKNTKEVQSSFIVAQKKRNLQKDVLPLKKKILN